MIGPFSACGIDIKGHKLTKRQLNEWTNTKTPHVVMLYTMGGIFTSQGDGIYTSWKHTFNSADDFWTFAREFRQRAVISET